jgi:hypothetical protein
MKRLLLAVAIAFAASTLDAQDSTDASDLGLSPDAIRSIQVRIADNATGACWTNLKEVREYAEEKLRSKGYSLVDEMKSPAAPNFWFWVAVGATRDRLDSCDGSISVSVQTIATVGEFTGRLVLIPEVATVVSSAGRNLNRRVLEAVQEMIDQM